MVAGFSNSMIKKHSVPKRISPAVMMITILLWSVSLVKSHFSGRFLSFPIFLTLAAMSCHTGNPRPPITIRNMVVKLISGDSAYCWKLVLPIMSIPALQNADTEWKMEYPIPVTTPYSGINLKANRTAPIPSTRKVPFRIRMMNFTIPESVSSPYACWIVILLFMEIRLPSIR